MGSHNAHPGKQNIKDLFDNGNLKLFSPVIDTQYFNKSIYETESTPGEKFKRAVVSLPIF